VPVGGDVNLVDEAKGGQPSRRRAAALRARHRQATVVDFDMQCAGTALHPNGDVGRSGGVLAADGFACEFLDHDSESRRTIGIEPGADCHRPDRAADGCECACRPVDANLDCAGRGRVVAQRRAPVTRDVDGRRRRTTHLPS
jgi:hypothetical protein